MGYGCDKPIMKIKPAALFLCLLCQTASAEWVRAEPDCAMWMTPDTAARELENKAWLIGFLSGANMAFSLDADRKPFNYFEGLTNGQIYLWMDNYCRANPLSSTLYGVGELMQQRNSQ